MIVDASDVAAFLGRSGDAVTVALAEQHVPVVTVMVKAYVRDNGFDELGEPADDLALVIVSSCARLVVNPEHTVSQEIGTFSIRQAVFNGWTLPELAVLHRYRKRAL
jgi:predicted ATP-dependent serine protease